MMPRLADHHVSRALKFRERAIELAQLARRENDPGHRRYLLDQARAYVNVADAIDPPPPPDEPQFRGGADAAKARAELINHLKSRSHAFTESGSGQTMFQFTNYKFNITGQGTAYRRR
jgi:hypothetical protein